MNDGQLNNNAELLTCLTCWLGEGRKRIFFLFEKFSGRPLFNNLKGLLSRQRQAVLTQEGEFVPVAALKSDLTLLDAEKSAAA